MKEAVGERAAELFVEEHEQKCGFGSFVGEPVVLPVIVFDNKIFGSTTGGFTISNIFG